MNFSLIGFRIIYLKNILFYGEVVVGILEKLKLFVDLKILVNKII